MEIRIKPQHVTKYTSIAQAIENCYNLIYLLHATLVESSNLWSFRGQNRAARPSCWYGYENARIYIKNSSSKVIANWQYFYRGPQHKSVQYKKLAKMFCIQTCCNHILSAAEGLRGRRLCRHNGNIFITVPHPTIIVRPNTEAVRSLPAVPAVWLNIDRTHFGPTKVTHFRNCGSAMLFTLGPLEQIWPTVYKNVSWWTVKFYFLEAASYLSSHTWVNQLLVIKPGNE